jgi:hypothetical protein
VGVERYSASGHEHLLIGTIDYDELDEEAIAVQVQIVSDDPLGLGALRGPERPGDILPIMWKLPQVTRAECYVEMAFDLPEDAPPSPVIFPLPHPVTEDGAPVDVITGIRGVKHKDGTSERAYAFILDKTDPPGTALSIDFPWEGVLTAETLANVADRAAEIASSLGLPAAEEREGSLLRPRPHKHRLSSE